MKDRFLYLDLGNVIFNFSGGLEALSQKFGVQQQQVEQLFAKYDDEICSGRMQPSELLRMYETQFGKSSNVTDFGQWWASFFSPIKPTHQLIQDAVTNGIKVGLISNIYPTVFPRLLENGSIPNVNYDSVVLSCDEGVVKPDRKIFEIAQSRAMVKPSNIHYLDDLGVNIDIARQMGWNSKQFIPSRPNDAIVEIRNDLKLPNSYMNPEVR